MFTKSSRRSARVIAVGGVLAALLAMPIGVAADTTGGGSADLGLDGVTITATTVQARTSLVTIAGTIDCSQDLTAFVWVDVSQVVGRVWTVSGGSQVDVPCVATDGSAEFAVTFYASNGKFVPGKARLQASADTYMCTGEPDAEECFYDSVTIGPMKIRLSR